MNSFWLAIFGGVVRTVIATAGGYAVAKGTLTANDVTQVSGAILTVGTGLWSVWQKVRSSRK